MTIAAKKISESCYTFMHEGESPESSWGSNVGMILTSDAALVIDTSMLPESAKEIIDQIEGKGAKIRFVINTHYHGDHTLCNQIFAEHGATIIAHENCRNRLEELGDKRIRNYIRDRPQLAKALEGLKQYLPDLTIRVQLTVHLGGKRIVIAHPLRRAHTDGDLYVIVPDEKVIFMGDLLWNQYHPNLVDADPDGWSRTLGEILNLDTDTFVPGHGPPSAKKGISQLRQYLDDLKRQVEQAASRGLSIEEIVNTVKIDFSEKWRLKEFLPSNVRRIYEAAQNEKG